MPVTGWRYHGRGACLECGNADAALHVAVIEGTLEVSGEKMVVRGEHLGHFPPVCKSCTTKFSLDMMCATHRYPIRISDGRCKLCPK